MCIRDSWFAGAYWQLGPALIDKMIGQELIGHAWQKERSTFGSGFYKPVGYFLWDTLPWSIALVPAVWHVMRTPAADKSQRRDERFLLCWLTGGMVIFSLAAHQRGNLLLPLLPPAALLAGREIAQRLGSVSAPVFARGATAACLLIAAAMGYYYIRAERANERVIETVACMEMAEALSQRVGRGFPFTYADAPFAVQFYSGTMQREISTEQALELLSDESPAFVVVQRSRQQIEQAMRNAGLEVFRVHHQPMSRGQDLYVLSNVPRLEATARFAAATGAVHLRGEGLRPLKSRERSFAFEGEGELSIRNISDRAHAVRVKYHSVWGLEQYARTLAPGETWDLILSAGNVMKTARLGE